MSENEKSNIKKLDEAAEKAGGFVSMLSAGEIHYDYRKISEYCKEKGIEPVDLTIRELNKCIVQ